MTKIKCPKCGYTPEDGESLTVKGTLFLEGDLRWSYEEGFEDIDWWNSPCRDPENEVVKCPKCGEYSPLEDWGFYDL